MNPKWGNLRKCGLEGTKGILAEFPTRALRLTPGLGRYYHTPNPVPGFVTMTDMLISSLNLILTRTNLTFSRAFTKLFSLFSFLLLYLNDITFYLIFRASTPYSKNNIIHQSFNIRTFT